MYDSEHFFYILLLNLMIKLLLINFMYSWIDLTSSSIRLTKCIYRLIRFIKNFEWIQGLLLSLIYLAHLNI